MRKKTLLFFIILFYVVCATAQTPQFKVSGRICDQDEIPVDGAVVTCLSLPDSVAIDNVVGDSEGYFALLLDGKYEGRCVLEISCVGYSKTNVTDLTEDMDIELTRTATMLANFTVVSQATMERRPGRFLYTPAANDFVKSINAYDMLKVTPLVKVEQDDISIVGKSGTQIYINGRPPVMDQKSVIEMLRSMPADRIRRVEIITQPNSSYWASYKGGIINIVIKPALNETINGRASIGTQYYTEQFSPYGSIYLAYEKNKWSASLSGYLSTWNTLYKNETTLDFHETGVSINSREEDENKILYGGSTFNLSYKPTAKSTVGGSVSVSMQNGTRDINTLSDYFLNEIPDYTVKSVGKTRPENIKPRIGIGLYYSLETDDSGGGLEINTRYRHGITNRGQTMSNYRALPEGAFDLYEMFSQTVNDKSNGYEAKIKYTKNFDKKNAFDFGVEHSSNFLHNDFRKSIWDGNGFVNDPTQTNYLKYDEYINALFADYERIWSDVFSTTFGLRGEYTSVKGSQLATGEGFRRNYFNLFPNIGFMFDAAENHGLSLDLSKNIYRPSHTNLNPFKMWNSQNSYSTGNPELKEMIFYNAEFNYMFLDDYIFGIAYSYMKNPYTTFTLIGDTPNTTIQKPFNVGHETILNISFNIDKSFFKGAWKPSLYVDTDYETASGSIEGQSVNFRGWTYYISFRNVIRLSEKGKCFLTLHYSHYPGYKSAIYSQLTATHNLGFNLSKRFDFGGVLDIGGYDLLGIRRKGQSVYMTHYIYNRTLIGTQSIYVSFSYSFGNNNIRGAKDASSSIVSDRRK